MKGELTEFGKEMRKFRVDRCETLKDMAGKVGFTAPYLSSIERGRRDMPEDIIQRIKEAYALDDGQTARLSAAGEKSMKKIKVDLRGATEEQRKILFLFARTLPELTEEQCAAIKGILQKVRESRIQ